MATPLRSIAFTTLRWGCAWAVIGLLLGMAMMFGRVPPIAEPGAPGNFGFYAFWIPTCLGVASVFGVLLGLIYGCLMAAMDLWWPRETTRDITKGSGQFAAAFASGARTHYGQRLICGALAGGMIGWPMLHGWNALWVAGLGMASALVAGFVGRPKARAMDLEPGSTDSK